MSTQNKRHIYFGYKEPALGSLRLVKKSDNNIHKYVFESDQGKIFFNSQLEYHVNGKLFKMTKPLPL